MFVTKKLFKVGAITIAYQMNPKGCHQLVVLEGEQVVSEGIFSAYQHPAFLKHNGKTYMIVTDYYSGEPLEIETLYVIKQPIFVDEVASIG